MIRHTRAGFKLLRETIGYSQRDVASIAGVSLDAVKRWERPWDGYEAQDEAPLEAWHRLESDRDKQRAYEDEYLSAAQTALQINMEDEDFGDEGSITMEIPYYRSQMSFDEDWYDDEGNPRWMPDAYLGISSWAVANAATCHIADGFQRMGVIPYVYYAGVDEALDLERHDFWLGEGPRCTKTRPGLRALRETIGYSQADVAQALDVTTAQVKAWERPRDDHEFQSDAPSEVWSLLSHDREAQVAIEREIIDGIVSSAAIDEMNEEFENARFAAIPYFRSQMNFEEAGEENPEFPLPGVTSWLSANAIARHVVAALEADGFECTIYYAGLDEVEDVERAGIFMPEAIAQKRNLWGDSSSDDSTIE